jgi:hypothetical protein
MKFISARSFKLISNSTNGDSWIGFVRTWWPVVTLRLLESSTEKKLGMLLGLFFPYLLIELALSTSSSLVLRIGMVFGGHLPFLCHVWVIERGAASEPSLRPSGW